MAPKLSEEEIDDLIYFSRSGEKEEFFPQLSSLAEREKLSQAEILSSAKDAGQSTCLHMATGNGHLDVVKGIVELFADRPAAEKQSFLDATNEFGNTGLHWAALGGHLDTVKYLVEQGASPVLANDKNYVPLDLASFNSHSEVVDYFLSQSEGMEGENGEGLNEAVTSVELEEERQGDAEGSSAPS